MWQVSFCINLGIAVFSVAGWLMILLGVGSEERLAANGRKSLKYFTVLSNLLSGIVSVACVCAYLCVGATLPMPLVVLKLVATSAVALTFLTVIVLLGPRLGWKRMYEGGNLWLHLILPLLAVIDCCLFVPVGDAPFAATLLAMLPTALYGAWYMRQVLVHGAEKDGILYDFYGFLRWGYNRIVVVFIGMLGVSWAIALLLRTMSRI